MKSSQAYLLMSILILTGIPTPSQSEVNPKTLNAKEKAGLTALTSPNLLLQKAGDGTWPINTKKGNEKVSATGQKKDEKPGGISEAGGVLIFVGVIATAIVGVLIITTPRGSC